MQRFPQHFSPPPGHFSPRYPGNNGQFTEGPRGFSGFHGTPNVYPSQRFSGPPPEQHCFGGPRPRYRGPSPGRFAEHPHPRHAAPFHPNGNGFGHSNTFQSHNGINSLHFQRFQGPTTNCEFSNERFKTGKAQFQKGDKKKKKVKVKEPKEVNYSHYCDVCDRGFKTDEQLQTHIAEHVKCKEKDCRFVGHPKVVKLHHKLQHGPGAKRIKWLDTPDEIQKWRNDRKRNFPTAANIAKKQEHFQQNEQCGNVLETKQFGKMRGQRGHRGRGRGRGHFKGQRQSFGIEDQQVTDPSTQQEATPAKKMKLQASDQSPTVKTSTALSQGAGQARPADLQTNPRHIPLDGDPLSMLAANENDSEEEETRRGPASTPVIPIAPNGCFGALGSLAASYDTDSEGSDTESAGPGVKERTEPHAECTEQLPHHGPASAVPVKGEALDQEKNSNQNGQTEGWKAKVSGRKKWEERRRERRNPKKIRKRMPGQTGAMKKRATLLEMLLAPEIRRERNILLQCVRHIVRKNFFQDSQTTP